MTGIERLRELIKENEPGRYIVVPAVSGTYQGGYIAATMDIYNKLDAIADQIEREQDKVAQMDWDAVREVAADMASRVFMSATIDELLRDWSRKLADASDGHDPAADVSMSAYDLLPQEERDAIAWVRDQGGLERVKQQRYESIPRAAYERKRRALLGHIAECETALGKRREAIARLADENDALRLERAQMRPRLMPDGMEWLVEAWPRFEDDAPVRFCDDFERDGEQHGVGSVGLCADGSFSVNYLAYSKGERIKRPAPKVLDADGVEVRVGDTVWTVESLRQGTVKQIIRAHDGKWRDTACVDVVFDGHNHGNYVMPDLLTHRAPVLAADGKPLREGETAYDKDGTEWTIACIDIDFLSDCVQVRGADRTSYVKPSQLTHERPDSYDELWEDIEDCNVGYTEFMRRVKKLAGGA